MTRPDLIDTIAASYRVLITLASLDGLAGYPCPTWTNCRTSAPMSASRRHCGAPAGGECSQPLLTEARKRGAPADERGSTRLGLNRSLG